ncbi:MAG TPA: NUDIX domain-containing protein [Patescibacteria group bacterium]|nr:NUDIX domain-containing protein [Patescibacteria group bacterium]
MNNLDPEEKIFAHISLKAVIRKSNNTVLFLKAANSSNEYDLPGGRIHGEEWDNVHLLKDILQREITEELGTDIKLDINPHPQWSLRHTSQTNYFDDGTPRRSLIILFEAQYQGGEIALSHEHSEYDWLIPETSDIEHMMLSDIFGKGLKEYFQH